MRILWLHQYFATPKGWGAVRTYEFARRFCSAGHEVDVVCCAGYDASLNRSRGKPVVADGIRVFVSGTSYRPHMGFLRRLWSFLSFMTYAVWFVVRKGRKYDVMITSSGPLTLAVPALLGRWLRRLPFVFEVIDVWPDSAIAAGVLKSRVLKCLSLKLEALAYKYAARIVTCSTGMTERVVRKLVAESEEFGGERHKDGGQRSEDGRSVEVHERGSALGGGHLGASAVRRDEPSLNQGEERWTFGKVTTISNCCDLEAFVPDEARRIKVREHYGVGNEQTVVLYTGAMGVSNAVDDLVEAVMKTAEEDRVVWWFAGGGPEDGKLRAVAGGGRSKVLTCESSLVADVTRLDAMVPSKLDTAPSSALESMDSGTRGGGAMTPSSRVAVRFFGSLPKEALIDLYLAADVNVVTFMHDSLFYENSPNKFFDGIAAGLPEVFNRSTWLAPLIKKYDCGIVCCGTESGREMAESIQEFATDPRRRRQMGWNARRLADEVFDRNKLAREYLTVLEKVTK